MTLKPTALVPALALLSLIACRNQEWKLDPAATGHGSLAIKQVKAHMSTVASLGAGTQEIGSRSPANSVGFNLEVTVNEGFLPGTALGTRSACLVGDHVWATPWVGDAGLHASEPGAKPMSFASQFIPNAFAAGPPTACEVRARVQPDRVGPSAPTFAPLEIARFCWTAKGLTDGACASTDLVRKIPGTQLETVGVRAAWSGDQGNTGALAVNAAITVGEHLEATRVGAAAMCSNGDGPPRQARIGILSTQLDQYDPGDTFLVRGDGFPKGTKLEGAPRCTIAMRYMAGPTADTWNVLSSHCLADGKVTDGACEGLAPGAVTLRMDGDFRVFLERGSHREGPFAIGPDPGKDAWAPLLASIALADDEGVVMALPSTLSHATVVSLTDALTTAKQKVSLSIQ